METKNIKLGILLKDFESLENWEYRIIEKIFDDPNLELSLIIKDGRNASENPNSFFIRFKRLMISSKFIATLIFKIQVLIERYIFVLPQNVDKDFIIDKLNKIDVVKLKPSRKGFVDVFSESDAREISSYKLDVILRHEFNIIRGEILKSAKYGIWSFHHGDNSVNRGGPAGFWEILLKESAVGVTLQQLTSELDGGLVIDKAFFNRHWSFVKTNSLILESSVSILFKNLSLLKVDKYSPKESSVYFNPLFRSPNLINTLKYIFVFYFKLANKFLKYVFYLIFGTRHNCWNIFIGKGNFLNSTLFRLQPTKMPKNEFWADPFIFKFKKENYVFFENYNYKTKIGKISCGKIKGDQIVGVSDVLNLGYHMSYPFVFEEDGEIYLMPETSVKNRLEIYRCINFPNKWELYSTAFDGEIVADAHIYKDEKNQKWLFINKADTINCSLNDELFIYKLNDLKFNDIQPHLRNPVVINSKNARNAGAIFKYKNDIYRPSQANIDGIYGRGLCINRIDKLTINEYIENTIVTAYPNFKDNLNAMHHLSQKDDLFVIDAAFKKQ